MEDNTKLNDEYVKMVNDYFSTNSTIVFGNLSSAHAAHVTKKLFEKAEKEIKIFSGTFCETFYSNPDVNNSLRSAIERLKVKNGKIKIVTLDEKNPSKRIDEFSELDGEKKVIEYLPLTHEGKSSEFEHFMVVDNVAYRKERGHEVIENTIPEVQAEVCANGKKESCRLSNYFDIIWNSFSEKK